MMQALDFPHLSQGRELDMLLGTDADLDFLTSGSFMMPDSNSLTGTYTGPMASSPGMFCLRQPRKQQPACRLLRVRCAPADQGLGLDPASLPSMQGVRGLQLTGLPPVVSLPMEQQQACGAGAGGGAGATTANQTGGAWLGQDMLGPLLGQPKPGTLHTLACVPCLKILRDATEPLLVFAGGLLCLCLLQLARQLASQGP